MCSSRGSLSTECPNSGWHEHRGAPNGPPRKDIAAAREVATAAAQGNMLAAATAADYFSTEDVASLQAAALLAAYTKGRGPVSPLSGLLPGAPKALLAAQQKAERGPSVKSKQKEHKKKERTHSRDKRAPPPVALQQGLWDILTGASVRTPRKDKRLHRGRDRKSSPTRTYRDPTPTKGRYGDTASSRSSSSSEPDQQRHSQRHHRQHQQYQQPMDYFRYAGESTRHKKHRDTK